MRLCRIPERRTAPQRQSLTGVLETPSRYTSAPGPPVLPRVTGRKGKSMPSEKPIAEIGSGKEAPIRWPKGPLTS